MFFESTSFLPQKTHGDVPRPRYHPVPQLHPQQNNETKRNDDSRRVTQVTKHHPGNRWNRWNRCKGFRRSADRLSNDPWKASATIQRPWDLLSELRCGWTDSKWPQKDVFRFSRWFDSWWFSSHERYFPKLVVFQCDLGTFRYNPTNHGISKLLVWRSKRTLRKTESNPLYRRVPWFLGKVTKNHQLDKSTNPRDQSSRFQPPTGMEIFMADMMDQRWGFLVSEENSPEK